jgi:hypothetical protein
MAVTPPRSAVLTECLRTGVSVGLNTRTATETDFLGSIARSHPRAPFNIRELPRIQFA